MRRAARYRRASPPVGSPDGGDPGDQTFRAPAGSYVVKPRGVVHAFWNATTEPATIIEVHSPGAFEHYYDAFGDLPHGEQRSAAMSALQARFGIHVDVTLAEEIVREHELEPPFTRGE